MGQQIGGEVDERERARFRHSLDIFLGVSAVRWLAITWRTVS